MGKITPEGTTIIEAITEDQSAIFDCGSGREKRTRLVIVLLFTYTIFAIWERLVKFIGRELIKKHFVSCVVV